MPANTKCDDCGLSLVPLQDEALFVERACVQCGRATYLFDRDPTNSGLRVVRGDKVLANPAVLLKGMKLVGGFQFSRSGLDLFVRTLLFPRRDLLRAAETDLPPAIDLWIATAEEVLKNSERLRDLDIDTEKGAEEAAARLSAKEETGPEFYAFLLHIAASTAKENLPSGDAWIAAGAAALAATAYAMLTYKLKLEEAAWRGHSVETLRTTLRIWEMNKKNDREEFWQQTFADHSIVLSQVFAAPLLVIGAKAYLGGKAVTNTGGHVADFLLGNELTSQGAIVELKTPGAHLLARTEYRNGIYAPSSELVSSVAQVSTYAASLVEDVRLRYEQAVPISPVRPECVVVIGTAETELKEVAQKRSFDLYRSELRNIRVITFDELFRRIASLLSLFGG